MKTKKQIGKGKKTEITKKNRKQSQKPILRAGLIPHAGESYSGKARKSVFNKLSPTTKYIIYIGTVHNLQPNDNVYLLHKTKNIFEKLPESLKKQIVDAPKDENGEVIEHSYKWVHKEIKRRFKNCEILALGPNKINMDLINWIVNFIKRNPNSVLLATTDLIHYGSRFNNMEYLDYPQQYKKQIKEEKLIFELTNPTKNKKSIFSIIDSDRNLMCGPVALKTFVLALSKLKYNGKVVDYYDSLQVVRGKKNSLDYYIILPEKQDEFVSYVSIVYGSNVKQSTLSIFDIKQAIGNVKTNIIFDVNKNNTDILLPLWSPFRRRTQGIFVGTTQNGKTNCSYGRFENGTNSAEKIQQASKNCKEDASGRWNIPYNSKEMDSVKYKVELLDPKEFWKPLSHKNKKKFPLDGKHGMYLTLPSGSSATYLPVVSKENPDMSIEEYYGSLSKKADGSENDWKSPNAKVMVYKSNSYIWDPKNQELIKS